MTFIPGGHATAICPTNKAFTFRQLNDALEWVEAQSRPPAQPLEDDAPLALQAMPLLARQSPQAIAALASMLSARTVKTGKKVYKAGVTDTDLLLIRRGVVKVSAPIRGKDQYHLATVGKGDALGSMGFLAHEGQAAEAMAVTEVEIYALPAAGLVTLAEQHPALALAISKHLTEQLTHYLRVSLAEIQALRG